MNLFQPFESRNDALHEVAGVFIYPIIYLVTGLVEAALDLAHILEPLFTGLNKGAVPLILFPPVYPVLLVGAAIVTVFDMMVAIFLAAGMLAKSAVGLLTGGVATAFSAADDFFFDDKEDSTPPQMTNSLVFSILG